MSYNQKISRAFSTPLRKRLVIGATSILATGALLGAGGAGATAATVHPTPVGTHPSVSAAHSRAASLTERLRTDLFQGQINGTKVRGLVDRIVNDPKLFSALPASLQGDLTSLKNAPTADTVADAQKIKATALAGGYGQQIQKVGEQLEALAGTNLK